MEVVVEGATETDRVPVDRVRFRRLAPLLGPLGDLGEHRAGHIDRFRARADFVDAYTHLSAPTRGLHGAVSAAVDLHPHQIGVARRVLADPVQRYLLADEVGLGKTIEAGFIIRQRLIDAPRSIIVVLTPSALRWQWNVELETKFALGEIRRGGVEVSSYEEERAFDRRLAPDLVVIDEAHRIAAGWDSTSSVLAERFEAARALAHRVPRLLLLSATPTLHRERDLLAMLHLLDPDTYRLEDLDTFTARVRDRELVGELLLALRPGAPDFLLSARLPDLRRRFGADKRMVQLLARVESILGATGDERESALADARSHVSEVYRLHRRLIRNRREAVDGASFRVRGRGGCRLTNDGDPRRALIDGWLERWRETLVADVHELGAEAHEAGAARMFFSFAAAAMGDLEVLRDLTAYRRTLKRVRRQAVGLSDEEAVAVRRGFPRTDAQAAALEDLEDLLGDPDVEGARRARRLSRLVAAPEGGADVVFATAPATIAALAEELDALGFAVWTFTGDLPDEERRPTIEAFVEGSGPRFLLCDAAGEEGLNLQRADRVVHLDLPLSTTRIEQRLGRLDRHGEGPPVPSLVLRPGPDHGIGAFWLRALEGSFGVFERTTATVQYAIEVVERDLLAELFAEGVGYANTLLSGVSARVAEEQERINRLDSLDALARQDADDVEFVGAVSGGEADDADSFADAFTVSLDAQRSDLGAVDHKRKGGGRCVSLTRAAPPLRAFSGVREQLIEATHERRTAVAIPKLSLLRPGAPLVEALRLQQEWDDRAQTAVFWQAAPDLFEDVVGVRCDFVIRADASRAFATWGALEAQRPREVRAMRTDADAPLAVAALQRRLDAYLPPVAYSVWFGSDGYEQKDAELVGRLDTAIANADSATGWGAERWDELIGRLGLVSLADLLGPIARRSPAAALAGSGAVEGARVAADRAQVEWAEFERLLTLRAEVSLDAASSRRHLDSERHVAEELASAIRAPVAAWSGACIAVLAAEDSR
jgi:ATP-dependent helicase HepA